MVHCGRVMAHAHLAYAWHHHLRTPATHGSGSVQERVEGGPDLAAIIAVPMGVLFFAVVSAQGHIEVLVVSVGVR